MVVPQGTAVHITEGLPPRNCYFPSPPPASPRHSFWKFRSLLKAGPPHTGQRDRETALREVSQTLGYGCLGPRIRDILGRTWLDSPEAARTFARWLGFTRTGATIADTVRSLINGL